MSNDRALIVRSILEQRYPKAQKLQNILNNLTELTSKVEEIRYLLERINASSDVGTIQTFYVEQLSQHLTEIKEAQKLIEQLIKRFTRPTLNIGVIGLARQGKSRFLRTLTSLPPDYIPDGDNKQCTGVRSTIFHQQDHTPFALVKLYSQTSFFEEVILAYYRVLRGRGLNFEQTPRDLLQWASRPLPAFTPKNDADAEARAIYERMVEYHTNFDVYRRLLGKEEQQKREDVNNIRSYVARVQEDGRTPQYSYIAVRSVDIYCNFGASDIGNIALVDMPGLGDIAIGLEQQMLHTLAEDVDYIFLIRKPQPGGDDVFKVDYAIWTLAAEALPQIPLNQWLTVVINRFDRSYTDKGDNEELCHSYQSSVSTRSATPARKYEIVNCLLEDQVNELLDSTLNYLVAEIEGLDAIYSSKTRQYLLSLQGAINNTLTAIRGELNVEGLGVDEYAVFRTLFTQAWDILTYHLNEWASGLETKRNNEDAQFAKEIGDIFTACDKIKPPSETEIKRLVITRSGYGIAYDICRNDIRYQFDQQLQHLLIPLEALTYKEVQSQAVQILVDHGRLNALAQDNTSEFFTHLIAEMPPRLGDLGACVDLFTNVTHGSASSQMLGIIQDALKPLTMNNAKPLQQHTEKSIYLQLDQIIKEVMTALKNTKANLARLPNYEKANLVRRFVDLMTLRKKTEEEWGIFYFKIRYKVWGDAIGDIRRIIELQVDCKYFIDQAFIYNQLDIEM